LLAGLLLAVGCADPQTIRLRSKPAGAIIRVESILGGRHYGPIEVGEAPVTYQVDNVGTVQTLHVTAELPGYELHTLTLNKLPSGFFGDQYTLTLRTEARRAQEGTPPVINIDNE
jgi:hypothetical protein